jgi:hypothetical protein
MAFSKSVRVVVAGRTRRRSWRCRSWHPRGEDPSGFVVDAMRVMLKMGLPRATVRSAGRVVLAGLARFWRWLPGHTPPGMDVRTLTLRRRRAAP